MIAVDVNGFTDVKHFTLQGIDYSHHFQFTFTDRSDLDAIIRKHKLVSDINPTRFSSYAIPDWFKPPADAEAFSNGVADPAIVLWIDDNEGAAYFQLVKI